MFKRIAAFLDRLVNPPPKRLGLPRPNHDGPTFASTAPPVQALEPGARPMPTTENFHMPKLKSGRARIHEAFDTSMPVASRDGLAGRSREIAHLRDAVIDHHKHAIIFGARGSGKTSLSRVFGDIADEAGCLVFYNAASGDIAFTALFRPFLKELIEELPPGRRADSIHALIDRGFDASMLANLLAETVTQPTILVLDEFDRVLARDTKAEIVSLMKLLSDMRSSIRIVLVGIAANLEDVVESHPSLRRHIASVGIAGITEADVRTLLDRCCASADLTIDGSAQTSLITAAVGSPYHLRLFGFHAALNAERHSRRHIDVPDVKIGLQSAFREWRDLSDASARRITMLAAGDLANAAAYAAFLAATKTRIDRDELMAELVGAGSDPGAASIAASRTIDALRPILVPSATTDQFIFEDALTPQFFLALYTGLIVPETSTNTPETQAFRAVLLRGASAL